MRSIALAPVREVVRVLEVGPLRAGGEPLHFRIEILKDSETGLHHPVLYQRSTYRLNPRFDGDVADEQLWVVDLFVDSEAMAAASDEECLRAVLQKLRTQFGTQS